MLSAKRKLEDSQYAFAVVVSDDKFIKPRDRFSEEVSVPEISVYDEVSETSSSGLTYYFDYTVPTDVSFLEEIYLRLAFPAQMAAKKGDFFSYTDYCAIKAVKNIKVSCISGGYAHEIYDINTCALHQHILEMHDNFDTIQDMFGGVGAPLKFAFTASQQLAPPQEYFVPIPWQLSKLKLEQLAEPLTLKIQVTLNPVEKLSFRSTMYEPNSGYTLKCCFNLINTMKCGQPYKKINTNGTFTTAPVEIPLEQYIQKTMDSKNDEHKINSPQSIHKFQLFIYNPFITPKNDFENLFYGSTCHSAICNYLNSFITPDFAPNSCVLQLKTITWTKVPTMSIEISRVDPTMIRVQTSRVNLVIKTNLAMQSLDSDIYIDLPSLLFDTSVLDMANFSQLDIQVLNYEDVYTQTIVRDRESIINGLYITKEYKQALVGVIDYVYSLEANRIITELSISRPATNTANEHAKKNYCIISDPHYLFADLDKKIKFTIGDLETATPLESFKSIDSYVLRLNEYKAAVNRPVFNTALITYAPAFTFTMHGASNVFLTAATEYLLRFRLDITWPSKKSSNINIRDEYISKVLGTLSSKIELTMIFLIHTLKSFGTQYGEFVELGSGDEEFVNQVKSYFNYDKC